VMADSRSAASVLERCDLLAGISEERGLIFHLYGSRAIQDANDLVAGWMPDAGMSVRSDPIGNVIGRYEGTEGKTNVLASHLDTVRDAGRYDGPLG
jgi:allantoate deiminase